MDASIGQEQPVKNTEKSPIDNLKELQPDCTKNSKFPNDEEISPISNEPKHNDAENDSLIDLTTEEPIDLTTEESNDGESTDNVCIGEIS